MCSAMNFRQTKVAPEQMRFWINETDRMRYSNWRKTQLLPGETARQRLKVPRLAVVV